MLECRFLFVNFLFAHKSSIRSILHCLCSNLGGKLTFEMSGRLPRSSFVRLFQECVLFVRIPQTVQWSLSCRFKASKQEQVSSQVLRDLGCPARVPVGSSHTIFLSLPANIFGKVLGCHDDVHSSTRLWRKFSSSAGSFGSLSASGSTRELRKDSL
jgi:hypothetical protein